MRLAAFLLAAACASVAAAQPPDAISKGDAGAARDELTRGAAWQARGFPSVAIDHFDRALDRARHAGERLLVADAYGALASAYGDAGHWDRALDFIERQHEADPRRTPDGEFRYFFQRGVAFAEFDDREHAQASLLQALSLARQSGDPRRVSMALGELAGLVNDSEHDTARALGLYDDALTIARSARLRDLEATWLLDSGAALRDANRFAEARGRFVAAMDVERRSGARRVTPAARKNLAQVLLHDGDRASAAAMLTAAEREADDQSLEDLRWQVRVERAAMAREDGDAAGAERLFDEALDIIEDAQGSVLVEQLRTGALRHVLSAADPYDLYVDFLLSRGNASKAFFVAERGRARAFLDTLRLSGDQIARALPPAYVEAEASLLSDISEGQAALRSGGVPVVERRALQAAIRGDEEQLSALRLRLAADRPAIAAVRYPQLWHAEDLPRRVLKPGQTLVAFFLGRTASVCWIVDASGIRAVRIAPADEIERATRAYLSTVTRAGSAAEPSRASELERLLFRGVTLPAATKELIVIPHGILHYLPLDVLLDAAGHRLVERYVLQYASSASSFALLATRAAPSRAGTTVLALGNPVVHGDSDAAARDADVEHLSLLKPLPYTDVELRAIARVYGPAARILERGDATEGALRDSDLSKVSILHFATHGLLDDRHPERSGLVLTARPPSEDGVLQMREVYGLRLRDALVTLSACETALGANVPGEGLVGLSRAFFYAGADTVVASLWNVNDRSTAELMTRFYEALGHGASAAAALREAKLRFIDGPPRMRDPFYWGAFVSLGNGGWSGSPPARTESAASRTMKSAALFALVALLALLTWGLSARRRRTRK